MEKTTADMQTKYLEICAPVLQQMHHALKPMIQADETLLDNFNASKMMIKVLADAGEIDALYQCGFLTEPGYEYCLKTVEEMKRAQLTTFNEKGQQFVVEPPALKVAKYLKGKNEYVPFDLADTDYVFMMQGAAQLFEMLHYNRASFQTDLSKELPQKAWHLGTDKDETAYMLLFHLTALSHGLKRVLPAHRLSKKTQLLLDSLITDFFQRACATLFDEGKKRYARFQNGERSMRNAVQGFPRNLSRIEKAVGLKKSERMMALGFIFEHFSGTCLAYSDNRQTMLLSGLVYAMRDEIERSDFSKLFSKDNPNAKKLGLMRKLQVLKWYDAHTAPFLKYVPRHVQTGVNKAFRNSGYDNNFKERG